MSLRETSCSLKEVQETISETLTSSMISETPSVALEIRLDHLSKKLLPPWILLNVSITLSKTLRVNWNPTTSVKISLTSWEMASLPMNLLLSFGKISQALKIDALKSQEILRTEETT
jgi:hypothetical protein